MGKTFTSSSGLKIAGTRGGYISSHLISFSMTANRADDFIYGMPPAFYNFLEQEIARCKENRRSSSEKIIVMLHHSDLTPGIDPDPATLKVTSSPVSGNDLHYDVSVLCFDMTASSSDTLLVGPVGSAYGSDGSINALSKSNAKIVLDMNNHTIKITVTDAGLIVRITASRVSVFLYKM